MREIAVLDQSTIDKIAAGEVIERPASVVKELVENAIDAGANAITVEIREGGISFIRITDNGEGIAADQVPLAFLRHATSKITRVEDLLNVASLGFRGEALSSIAAVCQVELLTKTAGGLTGVRYVIEGGKEQSLDEVGVPEGTTFLVRNVFYNTPARRKFLKSAMTEAGYVNDLIERMALSHPEIAFKFINNNQTRLFTSGNGNLKDVIYGIYGREIAGNLCEVHAECAFAKLDGFIGKPVISRGNRNLENYFINGRYMKSAILYRAIEDAYKNFMMQHKYPFTALHLKMNGDLLDINVHPTKMELRFSDNEGVYRFVCEAVREALTHKELIPRASFGEEKKAQPGPAKQPPKGISIPEPFETRRMAQVREEIPYLKKKPEDFGPVREGFKGVLRPPKSAAVVPETEKAVENAGTGSVSEMNAGSPTAPELEKVPGMSGAAGAERSAGEASVPEKAPGAENLRAAGGAPETGVPAAPELPAQAEQLNLFDEKLLSKENVKEHKIIGQLFDTYWLVEFRDSLYIIDQHAAHEKVLFERTMKSLETREYTSQQLCPPIVLTLSLQEEALLKQYMDNFTQIGFEIEHFGGSDYSIRAVPDNLCGIAQKDLFLEMLDSLEGQTGRVAADMINEKIASMSCKAAVKGNHTLSLPEVHALIDELMTLENPYNCPHGRPTIVAMTKYELEKKFKRIV
ncbi:MAG: DNA mismatch repair endonuclease MutL [Eubacteriales bacterium]|nr:DNA mismatch repair endonuclease MutL [Eubacteriales bacterium]